MREIKRTLETVINKNPIKNSSAIFIWGARQTGKTTYIKQKFPQAKIYDLLDTRLKRKLHDTPNLLRQEIVANNDSLVVIDEIQKVPELLDEVHWLIENRPIDIILCGSSARKLKDYSTNMLGGRALRYELYPLTTKEIGFTASLERILNHGLLPAHYLSENYLDLIESYIVDYLEEEIAKESRLRNLDAFSRFLKVVGVTSGQLLNYSNVASESGVSVHTVREYYQILKDTLLGFELIPWNKRKERRLIETSKFYLFDVGLSNYLRGVIPVVAGTDVWGIAFEHFIIHEIRAYIRYNKLRHSLYFYRTASKVEVDLIVNDMELALEFKSSRIVKEREHLKGIRSLKEEFTVGRSIVVSCDDTYRKTEDDIEIMPWQMFCEKLWNNEIIIKT